MGDFPEFLRRFWLMYWFTYDFTRDVLESDFDLRLLVRVGLRTGAGGWNTGSVLVWRLLGFFAEGGRRERVVMLLNMVGFQNWLRLENLLANCFIFWASLGSFINNFSPSADGRSEFSLSSLSVNREFIRWIGDEDEFLRFDGRESSVSPKFSSLYLLFICEFEFTFSKSGFDDFCLFEIDARLLISESCEKLFVNFPARLKIELFWGSFSFSASTVPASEFASSIDALFDCLFPFVSGSSLKFG